MKKRLIAALIGIALGVFLYAIAEKDSSYYEHPFHDNYTFKALLSDIYWPLGGVRNQFNHPKNNIHINSDFDFPYCTDSGMGDKSIPSGCAYTWQIDIGVAFKMHTFSFSVRPYWIGWYFFPKDTNETFTF